MGKTLQLSRIANDSPLIKEYINEISIAHKNAYDKSHLTSHFSLQKLNEYYITLSKYSDYVIVAHMSERAGDQSIFAGFVFCGKEMTDAVSKFKKANKIYLTLLITRNPRLLLEKITGLMISKAPRRTAGDGHMRLFSLCTVRNLQGMGIGSKLLSHLENDLISDGRTSYGLSVRRGNLNAVRFYLNQGFQPDGETSGLLYLVKPLKTRD